jgi:hypothetical protein
MEEWRQKSREAAESGRLYLLGSDALRQEYGEFNEARLKGVPEAVDPYLFQYDLLVWAWLHHGEFGDMGHIPKEQLIVEAARLRWPERVDRHGRPDGEFLMNPWAERILWAFSHYNDIAIFGGSGQGKTTAIAAITLMIWDMFITHPQGARACVSSTSESKLRGAAWAEISKLYRGTQKGVSNYAGTGDCRASMQVRRASLPDLNGLNREYSKDERGIIEGVLLGGGAHRMTLGVDRITGKHVPTALVMSLDEAQSMTEEPVEASRNLMTHPRWSWLNLAGNPVDPQDQLGKFGEPVAGWDSVDVVNDTHWETMTEKGRRGVALHFNNDHSPGMDDPDRYWYMPTKAKRDELWGKRPNEGLANYQRFWLGSFPKDGADNVVIPYSVVRETGSYEIPEARKGRPVMNAFSFDSAPSNIDRSQLTWFQSMVDEDDNWFLLFKKTESLPKMAEGDYIFSAAKHIREKCRIWNIPSGNGIVDATGEHGVREVLMRGGMVVQGLKFNERPTEGLIDYTTRKVAKNECVLKIDEAAILCHQFLVAGQIRGLHDDFCPNFKKEVCARRWVEHPSGKLKLEPKKSKGTHNGRVAGFRERMGFSPDVLDTIFMACFFARHQWGMIPGAPSDGQKKWRREEADPMLDLNATYDDDLLMIG